MRDLIIAKILKATSLFMRLRDDEYTEEHEREKISQLNDRALLYRYTRYVECGYIGS